jgi:oligopeptide/dipeptide ABC transporter ATP-binding protein
VLVTHNLGVVARYAQRLYIMYAGKIVEEGRCRDIFYRPSHPYTIGLLKSVPRLDEVKGQRLVPIEGTPGLIDLPSTCAFRLGAGRRASAAMWTLAGWGSMDSDTWCAAHEWRGPAHE